MKSKESGSQIDDPKNLAVNSEVKVEVKIIYSWVDPETFGTPEIDFGALSSPISSSFDLLDQQIANFDWIDYDSSLWIKKYGW